MSISSTLVRGADIRFHEAAGALRPFVGCFWVVTAERGATLRLVPDGTTAIAIRLQGDQPTEWVLRGPLIGPQERRFAAPAKLVGIRLRPGVAFLLSGTPAHTAVGRRIALRKLKPFAGLVADPLRPCTPERCIDVLQRFLLRRLEDATVHPVVAAALCTIEQAHGGVRVSDLATRCNVSARHLHRLMTHWVGFGPKRYASIIRFQATLHGIEDAPAKTPAALASDNGFFDQAHLSLDLGRFASETPSRLAATGVADFSKTRCEDVPEV
ncbi:MAG TPA: helix-turn-helix domain-containing protein [Gemmatimonadaceae bacterium]